MTAQLLQTLSRERLDDEQQGANGPADECSRQTRWKMFIESMGDKARHDEIRIALGEHAKNCKFLRDDSPRACISFPGKPEGTLCEGHPDHPINKKRREAAEKVGLLPDSDPDLELIRDPKAEEAVFLRAIRLKYSENQIQLDDPKLTAIRIIESYQDAARERARFQALADILQKIFCSQGK